MDSFAHEGNPFDLEHRVSFEPGDLSPRAGPSPDVLAAAAQRISLLAQDMAAVQLALTGLRIEGWRSPAAEAYRSSLTNLSAELGDAVRAVDEAAALVVAYGAAIQTDIEAGICAAPAYQSESRTWRR